MSVISRRLLAKHAASQIEAGENLTQTLRDVAAHLVETNRSKQSQLLVKDIILELEKSTGTVYGTLISAQDVSDASKVAIESTVIQATGAKKVVLEEQIDPSLVGGAVVATPEREIDVSIRKSLNELKRQ